MKCRYVVLVLLLIVLPLAAGNDDKKKPPSLEDDLVALQGEWGRVKAEGKYRITLVFGDGEAKNFLKVWETDTKDEVSGGSWGRIGMHEKDGKRTISVDPGKHIVYRLVGGKLVLDGEYSSRFLTANLTGEWKKLENKKVKK